ncbi:MAG: hypothetical protein ACHP6H_02930, partial [Legionellales bacterium]
MLPRLYLFLFNYLICIGVALAALTPKLNPLLVTVTLDGVPKTEIYRCYKDDRGRIWVSEIDLKKLGFPANPKKQVSQLEPPYVLLDEYEGIKYDLNEQALILTLLTPMAWHGTVKRTDIALENTRLRPERSGIFVNYDVTGRYMGLDSRTYTAAFT